MSQKVYVCDSIYLVVLICFLFSKYNVLFASTITNTTYLHYIQKCNHVGDSGFAKFAFSLTAFLIHKSVT